MVVLPTLLNVVLWVCSFPRGDTTWQCGVFPRCVWTETWAYTVYWEHGQNPASRTNFWPCSEFEVHWITTSGGNGPPLGFWRESGGLCTRVEAIGSLEIWQVAILCTFHKVVAKTSLILMHNLRSKEKIYRELCGNIHAGSYQITNWWPSKDCQSCLFSCPGEKACWGLLGKGVREEFLFYD